MTKLTNERDRAYISMNLNWFRKAYRENGLKDPDEMVFLASIHKARYECTSIPDSYRHDSRQWLEDHDMGRYKGAPWPPKGVLER